MNSHENRVPGRIKEAMNYLELASITLENIKKDARPPEVDTLINKAADAIFEAKEFLDKIDTEQYHTRVGGFVGESVKVFRHRKKKI